LANSAHLCRSALGAFHIGAPPPQQQPLLLVDDLVQSGWTLTVLAAQLREAGAGPVYPLVLQRGAGRG
jgi:ATP-dependent DNA helicase RecQ